MHTHTVLDNDALEDAGLLAVIAGLDFDLLAGDKKGGLADFEAFFRGVAIEQSDLCPGDAIDLALNLDFGDLVSVRNGLAAYGYGGSDQVGLGDDGGGHGSVSQRRKEDLPA